MACGVPFYDTLECIILRRNEQLTLRRSPPGAHGGARLGGPRDPAQILQLSLLICCVIISITIMVGIIIISCIVIITIVIIIIIITIIIIIGSEDPETLLSASNLACILQAQGRLAGECKRGS